MDSSFAETIPNATIDTTLSEPQDLFRVLLRNTCYVIYDSLFMSHHDRFDPIESLNFKILTNFKIMELMLRI